MSIQLYPNNSSITPPQNVPSPPSGTDPLSAVLSLSREQIYRKGMPTESFTTWVNQFREGSEDETILLRLVPETGWFLNTEMRPILMQSKYIFTPAEKQRTWEIFSGAFEPMTKPQFWQEGDIGKTLLNLYAIYACSNFPPNDPREAVFLKLMDCLVAKIVPSQKQFDTRALHISPGRLHAKNPEVTQRSFEVVRYKKFFFLNTQHGWRVSAFDHFPTAPFSLVKFNANGTQTMILDREGTPLETPYTLVHASRCVQDGELVHIYSAENLVRVQTVLYKGMGDLVRGQNNSVTFHFFTDLSTHPLKMMDFRQFLLTEDHPLDKVSAQQLVEKQEAEIADEGYDLSPKTVIDRLVTVAKKEYTEALTAPKTPPAEVKHASGETKTTTPVPPTKLSPKDLLKKQKALEAQVSREQHRAKMVLE